MTRDESSMTITMAAWKKAHLKRAATFLVAS